jgi:hypothetical protein
MPAPKLTQIAYKVTSTRNKYGDVVYGTSTSLDCLFREFTSIDLVNGLEQIKTDAIVWLAPSASVLEGDVLQIDGGYYRIEKIIQAKDRLRNNEVKFLKCEVNEQRRIS